MEGGEKKGREGRMGEEARKRIDWEERKGEGKRKERVEMGRR